MELKRVVVTGLGSITPIGNTVPDFWNGLVSGKSGCAPVTRFDASKFHTRFACEVKGFDPLDHFERKDARKYDRFTQFALVAAKEALTDSQLDLDVVNKYRVGVIFASGVGGIETIEQEIGYYYVHEESGPHFNPFFIPKLITDMAAGQISLAYGFHGPNFATTSACASSNNAIGVAFDLIRLGKADVMVAGGSEAPIGAAGLGGFGSMHALSTRNDDPQGASRPFSKSRDGFVLGEGAGCLILEEYEHAVARGAKIYAEVAGVGYSADAYHLTATHPDGFGAQLVMKNALDDAGMTVDDIDYINVHGTSTPLGDISEAKAIETLFGDAAKKLNISSTKSMTGHLLGGAGAIEAVASIMAMKEGVVPPTINHADGDDDESINYEMNFTFNTPQKREIRAVMSNTFGFGGHNASVIFKHFEK